MIGLKALFIWIGIPVILMSFFELDGLLWTFFLGGIFGFIAMVYFSLATAKKDGVDFRDPEAVKNYTENINSETLTEKSAIEEKETTSSPSDSTLASWVASLIEGTINSDGFSELERPNTAIVIDNEYRASLRWLPDLKISENILSFIYLKETNEFAELKSSLCSEKFEGLPPEIVSEIVNSIKGTMIQSRFVDNFAISITKRLLEKDPVPNNEEYDAAERALRDTGSNSWFGTLQEDWQVVLICSTVECFDTYKVSMQEASSLIIKNYQQLVDINPKIMDEEPWSANLRIKELASSVPIR